MERNTYNRCTQCGVCCLELGARGVMPDRGDGACVNLGEDNRTCMIYDNRPEKCQMFDDPDNVQWCNDLQEQNNIPVSFRVKA